VVTNLKRLTTEYIESEDRIKIIGESGNPEPVVIWMTCRLASRVIPAFLGWLDKQAPPSSISSAGQAEVLQSFAQEAAVAALKPEKPVSVSTEVSSWLLNAVDVAATRTHMTVTFRDQGDRSASVRFDSTQLRQWLSILHRLWLKAEWPTLVWPKWIKREKTTQQQVTIH
jgi:hypothetical protein